MTRTRRQTEQAAGVTAEQKLTPKPQYSRGVSKKRLGKGPMKVSGKTSPSFKTSMNHLESLRQERQQLEKVLEEKDQEMERMEQEMERMDQEMERMEQEFQDMSEEKDKEYEVLRDEMYRVALRLDKQLGDGTFQATLNGAYYRLKDFFLAILLSTQKEPLDIKTPKRGGQLEKFLRKYVPSFENNSTDDKLNVCLAVVASALVTFVNEKWPLGFSEEDSIGVATRSWRSQSDHQSPKLRKLSKQWLSITNDLLNETENDKMEASKKASLTYVVTLAKRGLESATSLKVSQPLFERLMHDISPCMENLRMLHFQNWQFDLSMLPAHQAGSPMAFDAEIMESMLGEQDGYVKASVFPLLRRKEDEKGIYATVYNAKVAVFQGCEEISNSTEVSSATEELSHD